MLQVRFSIVTIWGDDELVRPLIDSSAPSLFGSTLPLNRSISIGGGIPHSRAKHQACESHAPRDCMLDGLSDGSVARGTRKACGF